jgi:hypothetical protein
MKTKKYWQAVDKKDETYLFPLEKPRFNDGMLRCSSGVSYIHFLFPIPLKRLQIAEITVNSDGTWSYEIEREKGWYMARHKSKNEVAFWRYESGAWREQSRELRLTMRR